MEKMSIAAQLYTLRDFLKTPEDIKKTLKRVKDMGYYAIQVSGIGEINPDYLKSIVEGLGLKICVTHIPYTRLKNELDAVIQEHKLWECEYVGLGVIPHEYRGSSEGYMQFIGDISEVAKTLKENGLQFVYHNHHFEFEKYNGIRGMDILLKETDPETFWFELDTYWMQVGGANPVDWIRKVEGRMSVIHLKDMAIKNGQQVFAEIGEGNLDWELIIKACRETGVKWYAVEQDICQRDPFESLEISLKYLHKLIQE